MDETTILIIMSLPLLLIFLLGLFSLYLLLEIDEELDARKKVEDEGGMGNNR